MLISGARVRFLLMTLTAASLGAVLTACGGGGGGLTPALETADSWPGHGWEGAVTAGDFALVAVDDSERQLDPLTEQLALSLSDTGGRQVSVSADLAAPTDHAWLHLRYDAQAVHPVATRMAPELEGRALFLGITEKPGVVSLGIATIGGVALLAGEQALCSVEFAPGPHTGTRKVSAVSDSVVTDLHFNNDDRSLLEWTYRCKGDYNQDSLVTVADLTPIGIYFEYNFESPGWQAAQVADGDENLYITVSDLTPIGQNFDEAVTGYKVQGGSSQSGPFAGEAIVPHSKDLVPEGGGFLHFTYDVPAPVEGAWYVIWAMQNTQVAAEHSNAAQYSEELILAPPTQLVAVREDDHILLSWEAPSGAMPDGYEAYVSTTPTLVDPGDGIKLHTGTLSGTTLAVDPMFSPDNPHYFGVLAVYGSERSPFSNIFHYQPGGTDAPSNLLAMRSGDHIQLSWDAPALGTPDGYNAYIASNGEMTGALPVNGTPIATTTFDADPVFSPDTEHYFGVKAIYGAAESEYSNIYHYDPAAEQDPPTWDNPGEVGIKAATPGDERVTVEWWTASDAESGPVTYLIHWDEEASFDWATANVVTAAATDVDKSVTGLTNGVAYEFGVRARDTLGNTDDNTNTLVRTPLGGGVPYDDGVWQDSELVDDGGIIPKQEVGWFPDVEVKSDGTIGIAHYNNSLQDLMYSEKPSGGSWTTVTVDSESDTGSFPDLEFHPTTGHPCIAYHHAGAQADGDEALVYAEFNGSSWNLTDVDTEGDVGAYASLEFDPADDRPAIAYWNASAFDAMYAKFNGTSWTRQVAYNGTYNESATINMSGAFTSLAFNPTNDMPAIAFFRTTFTAFDDFSAYFTEFDGGSWNPERADGGELADELGINFAGWETNLAFTPDGRPYIIHYDLGVQVVRVADRGGEGWAGVSVGSSGGINSLYSQTDIHWGTSAVHYVFYDHANGSCDFGSGLGGGSPIESGVGALPSLEIDASGNFHVAYFDQGNQELRYATSTDGIAWTVELASSITGGTRDVGSQASLQYHPTGYYPLSSYYDATRTALKFADRSPGTWRNETVANDGFEGMNSAVGIDASGTAYIGYYMISEDASSGAVRVARGEYGSWTFDEVATYNQIEGGDVVGPFLTVAVNHPPLNSPGLVYSNETQRTLAFAEGSTGGSYEIAEIDNMGWPQACAVAYNPGNLLPGVAYQRSLTETLHYAARDGGGTWTPEPVDTNAQVGYAPSLCYSAIDGTAWISYYDNNLSRLKVAYQDDGSWSFVAIPAPDGSADYGGFSSIAWHPQHNRPAIAFYDTDAGKLWYVFIGDPAAPQAAVEVTGGASIEGAYCSLRFKPDTNQPGIAYQDVTDGDLRYVERHSE